jgi:hypothetical protein
MNATPLDRVIAFASADGTTKNLSPDAFVRDFVCDIVKHAAPKLEEARISYRETGEDGLTHALLLPLYSTYHGASRETDTNGHVDISLKHPVLLNQVLLGEAKIIGSGQSFNWYAEGLTKLVGKYNSGRNNLALMVCYCRYPEMYTKLASYRERVASEKIADFQSHCDPAELDLAGFDSLFLTKHLSSGRTIRVAHAWVNMYSPTDTELFALKMPPKA